MLSCRTYATAQVQHRERVAVRHWLRRRVRRRAQCDHHSRNIADVAEPLAFFLFDIPDGAPATTVACAFTFANDCLVAVACARARARAFFCGRARRVACASALALGGTHVDALSSCGPPSSCATHAGACRDLLRVHAASGGGTAVRGSAAAAATTRQLA